MALQLVNFAYKNIPVAEAYARVSSVQLNKNPTPVFYSGQSVLATAVATVTLSIYATKALRTAGKKPLRDKVVLFIDSAPIAQQADIDKAKAAGTTLAPILLGYTDFTTYFGAPTNASAESTSDILMTEAYNALSHSTDPTVVKLLAASTAA